MSNTDTGPPSRGWFVFPVGTDKKPLITRWEQLASDDPAQIEQWARQFPGCNWAAAPARSGHCVIDLDVKDGKDGPGELFDLQLELGALPETLTVRSPSGGYHYWFEGITGSSNGKLAPGIDVKSSGGYVLIPPSRTEIGEYQVERDVEIAQLPEAWVDRIGKPTVREEKAQEAACELDTPENILAATRYAMRAEPSIMGQSGDDNAIRVVYNTRDRGVSKSIAGQLLWEYWNPRCVPPWESEEFEEKLANGYRYARKPAGTESPEFTLGAFEPVGDNGGGGGGTQYPPIKTFQGGDVLGIEIKPREWILGRRYLRKFISLTVAPGGQGKSTFTMAEAVSIACGKPLTGDTVHVQGRVWIHNAEDPIEEMQRRLQAVAIEHGLTKEDLDGVILSSGLEEPLIFAEEAKGGAIVRKDTVARVVHKIKEEQIILFIGDPFIRLHKCGENDNTSIDKAALALAQVASLGDCSIGIVHHSRKGANGPGDMDSARGASSLVSAVRIAHTLVTMSEKEARGYKIPEGRRKWFVRLDDAKANLSPPSDSTSWFERVSVRLPNGEDVGTIKPVPLSKEDLLTDEERTTVDAVFRLWKGPISCHKMAKAIRENIETFGEMPHNTLKVRIIKLFSGVNREKDGLRLTAIVGDGETSTRASMLVESEEMGEEED